MVLVEFLKRVRTISEHPLSPTPLVVVFLGYWMPLEWIFRWEHLLRNASWMELLHVIATSVILSFCPALLMTAVFTYGLAGLVAICCRMPMVLVGQKLINVITYLTLLFSSAKLLKENYLTNYSYPVWMNIVRLTSLVLIALILSYRNISPMRWLVVPKYIATVSLVCAIFLVPQELISHSRARALARLTVDKKVEQRPDIILITLDALAAGHLHTNGYDRLDSPALDAFAGHAIQFDNFYANANWTRPGVASLLHGTRPWSHGGDLSIPDHRNEDAQNLISELSNAGYDIRTVSSNEYADLDSQGITVVPDQRVKLYPLSGLVRKVEDALPSSFMAIHCGPNATITWILRHIIPSQFGINTRQIYFGEQMFLPRKMSEPYIEETEDKLRTAPTDRPLFYWIHVVTPHTPYAAPKPYLGRFDSSEIANTPETSDPPILFRRELSPELGRALEARYDESILMTDDTVAGILKILKDQGRFEKSLIVVTADHGESFNPHYAVHGGPVLSEELVHIPCLIKPPFYVGNTHESKLFEQVDIAPTILRYAGVPVPSVMEGRPYQEKYSDTPVFSMNRFNLNSERTFSVAMRDGEWKYVAHMGPWHYPWPQKELYNLANDPKETINLVDREPARASLMQKRIMQEVAKHKVNMKEYQ